MVGEMTPPSMRLFHTDKTPEVVPHGNGLGEIISESNLEGLCAES